MTPETREQTIERDNALRKWSEGRTFTSSTAKQVCDGFLAGYSAGERAGRTSGIETAAKAMCNFCQLGQHAFLVCECGHGENYHRSICHANCACRRFCAASPNRTVELPCSAAAIRQLISQEQACDAEK